MRKQVRKQNKGKKASSASRAEIATLQKKLQKLSVKKATPFGDSGSVLGSSVARLLGMNGSAGADWGRWAGTGVGKIFGSGAYKFSSPNSVWNTAQQVPVMHSSSDSIVLCHREYIGDISSSVNYTNQLALDINPGLSNCFPYLSAIAQNFQEFRFKGLVFEFKSTSADALNSTNTALGNVMMVAQYRSDAPPPANKQILLNEMWAVDGKPSENIFLPIECSPAENPLKYQYIRSSSLATAQDQKFYDLAQVYVATSGSQAAAVVGELWVTYEVELLKPAIATASSDYSADSAHFVCNAATTASPCGNPVAKYNNYPATVAADGTVTLPLMPKGAMFNVIITIAAGTSSSLITITSVSTALFFNLIYDGGVSNINAGATTTRQVAAWSFFVNNPGTVPSFKINSNIVGAATTEIVISQLPVDFV